MYTFWGFARLLGRVIPQGMLEQQTCRLYGSTRPKPTSEVLRMAEWISAGRTESIVEEKPKIITYNYLEIAIFLVDGKYFALRNFCPHRGGPIAEGIISGNLVTCPYHDWTFEISTGECTMNPAARVERFPTRIVGEEIEVQV